MVACTYQTTRHACAQSAEPRTELCFWHQQVEGERRYPPDVLRILEDRVATGEPIDGYVLFGAPLAGARLAGAQAAEVRLDGADLSGAQLERATLLSAYLIATALQRANLRGAQLKFANLRQADLTEADLSGAVLRICEMPEAGLSGARLAGADLSGSDLRAADFRRADLSEVNLKGADLRGCQFEDAQLSGIQFDGSTRFDQAEGLERAFEVPEALCQRLGIRRRSAPAPKTSAAPPSPASAAPAAPTPPAAPSTKTESVVSQPPKRSSEAGSPQKQPAPSPKPPSPPAASRPRPAPASAPRPQTPSLSPSDSRPVQRLEGHALWDVLMCGEPDRVENAARQIDRKARAHYAARLVPIALGDDPARALAAAEALALLPEPSVAQDLLRALIRGGEGPSTNAAFVFRKWSVPVLEAPLLKLLDKLETSRKANVLWILEEVGRNDSLQPVEALLQDPNEDVRAAAESALARIRSRVA